MSIKYSPEALTPNIDYNSRFCVIVDGFSSGGVFVNEFKKLGLQCIHVQSSAELKLVDTAFNADAYVINLVYRDNFEDLVEKLEHYNPIFVMPGFHTSVYLAEKLGTRLKTPSNNSLQTSLRMDKFLMHKRLAECRRNHAKSYLTQTKEELLEIYQKEFQEQQVVIKPSNSAGTDQVTLCNNRDELINAFNQIMGKKNALSEINRNVLIQEYLEGSEYIINTVTIDGIHITTDIWLSAKYTLDGNNFLYDKTVLLDAEGPIQNELCRYNNQVLDALGFKFGCSHNELMLTAKGPVLIEMNPRISGGNLPAIARECTGMGQIGWTNRLAENILKPQKIDPKPYSILKYALSVTLNSRQQGIVAGYRNQDKLRELPSFFSLTMRAKVGEQLNRTTDVWSSPGIIHLMHHDAAVLENDYIKAREIEADGLFTFKN